MSQYAAGFVYRDPRKSLWRYMLAPVLVVAATLGLLACNHNDSKTVTIPQGAIRILHASPDAPPVNVKLDGMVAISDLDYAQSTGFVSIAAKDYDEALAIANDTPFGLSSGICTSSLKHAAHFRKNSQAGMVMVNLPTAGVDYHVPFGGRKGSSYGPREQGRYAQEFYTTVKTSYVLP